MGVHKTAHAKSHTLNIYIHTYSHFGRDHPLTCQTISSSHRRKNVQRKIRAQIIEHNSTWQQAHELTYFLRSVASIPRASKVKLSQENVHNTYAIFKQRTLNVLLPRYTSLFFCPSYYFNIRLLLCLLNLTHLMQFPTVRCNFNMFMLQC